MIFIQLSAFILLVMGIVWVLELTPERINKDLSGFLEKRESLCLQFQALEKLQK